MHSIDTPLVDHLVATTGLSPTEAVRVVDDVVAYFSTTIEDYARRRHTELKTYGARNPEIYARIAKELRARLVVAPDLTERQLRRLISG